MGVLRKKESSNNTVVLPASLNLPLNKGEAVDRNQIAATKLRRSLSYMLPRSEQWGVSLLRGDDDERGSPIRLVERSAVDFASALSAKRDTRTPNLEKVPSLTAEEVNQLADEFIARFHEQMRLDRQKSNRRVEENLKKQNSYQRCQEFPNAHLCQESYPFTSEMGMLRKKDSSNNTVVLPASLNLPLNKGEAVGRNQIAAPKLRRSLSYMLRGDDDERGSPIRLVERSAVDFASALSAKRDTRTPNLERVPSLTAEEVNQRADEFIARFHEQMRLDRQKSNRRAEENLKKQNSYQRH